MPSIKMNVKKGDKVQVLSGKDKGAQGEVIKAMPRENKVVVEGVAMVKKHVKADAQGQGGGIVEKEAAIDASQAHARGSRQERRGQEGSRLQEVRRPVLV